MRSKAIYFQILGLAVFAHPIVAAAHPMHWATESIGFLGGLSHPLTGSDHIITMLVVGFWISQASGLAARVLPLIFISLMLFGCGLTLLPIELANAENIMNLSALILGIMLAIGYKVSFATAALVVGNLALYHGYVHAYDIWLDIDGLAYTAGFALSTLVLIVIGVAMRQIGNRIVSKMIKSHSNSLYG
jgi:urease accessory protein